jgi:hypothetical protein
MLALWVALSAVAAAQGSVKLAAPGLTTLNLSPEAATYFLDHLGHQLQAQGVEVLTSSEIAALLGLERQRQLLGCADEQGSCLAEMANALGTDGLLRGSLGHFGQGYQLDLKLLSSSGQTLASFSKKVDGDEALLSALDSGAAALASQLFTVLHRARPKPEPPLASDAPRSLRWGWWVLGGVGAAAGLCGALLMALPTVPSAKTTSMGDLPAAISQLQLDRQLGLGLLIAGAAALATGVLGGVLTSPRAPAVTFVPTGQGAALVVLGTLP